MTGILKRGAIAIGIAGGIALAGAAPASAQARGDLLDAVMRELALCAEIGDQGARLGCYDRIGERAAGRQPRRVDGSAAAPTDNPADRAFQPGQPPAPYPGPNYAGPNYGGPTPIVPGQQGPGQQGPGQPGYVPPPLPGAQPYSGPPANPPPSAYYQPGDPRPLEAPPGGNYPPPASTYPGANYPGPAYPGSTYPGSTYPNQAGQPRDIGPPPGAGTNPDAAFQPGAQPPPAGQRNARANNPPNNPSGALLPPVTVAIRQLRDRDYKWEVTVDVTNNTNRTVSQAVVACTMGQGPTPVGDYNAVARSIPPGVTLQAVAVGPETSRAYIDTATCRVLSPLP